MVLLDYLFYFAREYRVLTALGLLVLWLLLALRPRLKQGTAEGYNYVAATPSPAARLGHWLRRLLPVLALLVLCFGRVAGREYVHSRGVEGTGLIVSTESGIKVNKHYVRKYRTLLTLQDGSKYLTKFDEQSGAFYGEMPGFGDWFPNLEPGETVKVKYLPQFPSNFIVLADDFSTPFGTRVLCEGLRPLQYEVVQAETPYRNAPSVPEFGQELVASLDKLLAAAQGPCLSADERARYTAMRDAAKSGQPLP